jgi:hypothetical protein
MTTLDREIQSDRGREIESNPPCPAALNVRGQHFDCDWPTDADGTHAGWAHSSRAAEAIWTEDRHLFDPVTREWGRHERTP